MHVFTYINGKWENVLSYFKDACEEIYSDQVL